MITRWGAAVVAGLALAFGAGGACADCKLVRYQIPVTMVDLGPTVSAKVNGADVRFLVDSGAFFNVVSAETESALKLPRLTVRTEVTGSHVGTTDSSLTLEGVGGETQSHWVTVKAFGLGESSFADIPFLVLGGIGDHQTAGVLGQNLFGAMDDEYDFANGVMTLVAPHDCGKTVLAYWVSAGAYGVADLVRGDAGHGRTAAEVTINGVKLRAIFDTGAGTSMISVQAAARAGVKVDDPAVRPAGYTTGIGPRPVQTWIADFASVDIGGEEIRNARLRVGDMRLDGVDMLIGADFFLSHHVYVANSQHKIYFTYNGGPVFNLTANLRPESGQAPPATPQADASPQPADADGFSRRGAASAARLDLDHAIADFSRAIQMDPNRALYFYQRGAAYQTAGKADLALADLDQALRLSPDDPVALEARAELRLTAANVAGAVADLDAAAQRLSPDARAHLDLGYLYDSAGRFDAAVAHFDLWIAAHATEGTLAEALAGRCQARALWGRDLDKALADCNRALGLAPAAAGVRESRGLIRLRRGELDPAIADFDAALAARPDRAWSLYGRGLARLRRGQNADGRADMAAAVALDPDVANKAKRYGIATGAD